MAVFRSPWDASEGEASEDATISAGNSVEVGTASIDPDDEVESMGDTQT